MKKSIARLRMTLIVAIMMFCGIAPMDAGMLGLQGGYTSQQENHTTSYRSTAKTYKTYKSKPYKYKSSSKTYKAKKSKPYKYKSKKATYSSSKRNTKQKKYYYSNGRPKVQRSASARNKFLKSKGYKKTPNGYEVDHIIPLSQGGSDTPSNMQLLTKQQHKRKTAREAKYRSKKRK